MAKETTPEGFTDLSEYKNVGTSNLRAQNNVVKGVQIVHRGTEEIHRLSQDADQPEIFVQRDGETVLSIDFVCKCGRTTSVRFEYEEE